MPTKIVLKHLAGSTLAGQEKTYSKDRIKLGRTPDNDVIFDRERDRMVSGHHAEIFVENGALFVRDVGSTNGTFVNDDAIKSARKLTAKDVVRLGDAGAELRVRFAEEDKIPIEPFPMDNKRFIGEQTLQRVVSEAVDRERWNTRVILASLAVGAACVLMMGVYLYARGHRERARQQAEQLAAFDERHKQLEEEVSKTKSSLEELRTLKETSLKAELARYENELKSLKGMIGEGESKIARLMVEIRQRDLAVEQIQKDQSLSKEQRQALVKETEDKVAKLQQELKQAEESLRNSAAKGDSWAELADRYNQSVFLAVGRDLDKKLTGTGTSYVIRADGLLATNSHVVKMLEQMPIRAVIQNGTGRIFSIKRSIAHPDFKGVQSPDVGLLQIDTEGVRLLPFPLATTSDLKQVRIGTHLGTLGYPGELQPQYLSGFDKTTKMFKTVQATFKDGWVGRITNYRLEQDAFPQARFIQHSASLTQGTSGSPMFTPDGKVVAMMASVYTFSYDIADASEEEPKEGKAAGKVRFIRQQQASSAQIGWAIRIDEVTDFLARTGW